MRVMSTHLTCQFEKELLPKNYKHVTSQLSKTNSNYYMMKILHISKKHQQKRQKETNKTSKN